MFFGNDGLDFVEAAIRKAARRRAAIGLCRAGGRRWSFVRAFRRGLVRLGSNGKALSGRQRPVGYNGRPTG
jgi:hypothetical protein